MNKLKINRQYFRSAKTGLVSQHYSVNLILSREDLYAGAGWGDLSFLAFSQSDLVKVRLSSHLGCGHMCSSVTVSLFPTMLCNGRTSDYNAEGDFLGDTEAASHLGRKWFYSDQQP